MRKRLLQSFHENENEAMAALARRWASTKHVQEMVELLAKLEGEFTRESQEVGSRGISVIVIRGEGAIDPAEFRRNCEARMAREAEREGEPQVSRRSER